MSPDDAIMAVIDTLPLWFFEAKGLSERREAISTDFFELEKMIGMTLSVEAGLRDLWNAALWEGCELSGSEGSLTFGPRDTDQAHFLYACQMRAEAAMIGPLATFHDAPLDTTAINHIQAARVRLQKGRRRKYEVGPPTRMAQRKLAETLDILEKSYLSDFLDSPLTGKAVNFTVRQLVSALWVLDTLTASMESSTRRYYIRTYRDACEFSFRIPQDRCVALIKECLDITPQLARELFEQLRLSPDDTAKCFQEGVWLHPIIELDEEEVMLVRPSIAVGSKIRFVERTLKELLGDDLSKSNNFGGVFEKNIRSSLQNALEENEIISDFDVLPHALKREDDDGEEIDAIIRVGSSVLVCELKCLLAPSEPMDRHNLLRKLEDAAGQARRKASWLKDNLEVIESLLDGRSDSGDVRILPVVVLNHKIGAGQSFGEVVIIDQNMLTLFLGEGSYNSGAAIHKGRKALSFTRLYSTQEEAEKVLFETLSEPPPLRPFLEAEDWVSFGFPIGTGELKVLKPTLKPEALADDAMRSTANLNRAGFAGGSNS